MKKTYIICYGLLSIAAIFTGCTESLFIKGNRNYENMAYHKSITYYEKALAKKNNPEALIKLADAYRLTNNYTQAETVYKKVIALKEALPIHHYYLAKMLMTNGKYDEAALQFKIYTQSDSSNVLAKSLAASCIKEAANKNDSIAYVVSKINIDGFPSAFAEVLYKNGIVFTASASQNSRTKIDPFTGAPYFNLYYTEKSNNGSWQAPAALEGGLNLNYHEGAAVFTKDGSTIYFTRSNYAKSRLKKNSKDESSLKIFRAQLINGRWGGLYELPINSDDYSTGQPALSADEKTLFFISDMPGGFGGTDIYSCSINDGKYTDVKNLGAMINTSGNEMFPSYDNEKELLYFSSEGHSSLGGLDIFKTALINGQWTAPVNMGFPINTSKDDFSFVQIPGTEDGYLSSNRDSTDCIYQFSKTEPLFTLSGKITLQGQNVPLADVMIKSKKQDVYFEPVITDKNGDYNMLLQPNTNYIVYAVKDGYFASKSFEISTKKESAHFIKDLEMEEVKLEKPIVIDNIVYDLNKWNIQPNESLAAFIEVLKENPGLVVELSSHTDSRGSDAYNLILSQKRAAAAVQYITSKGVDPARIIAKGYGETRLLNKCQNGVSCSEEEHHLNRRTEFKVIKINKTDAPVSVQRN